MDFKRSPSYTLHIKSANPTDRIFILDGNLVTAQP